MAATAWYHRRVDRAGRTFDLESVSGMAMDYADLLAGKAELAGGMDIVTRMGIG